MTKVKNVNERKFFFRAVVRMEGKKRRDAEVERRETQRGREERTVEEGRERADPKGKEKRMTVGDSEHKRDQRKK